MLDIDVLVQRTARPLGIHGWGYRNFPDLRLSHSPEITLHRFERN